MSDSTVPVLIVGAGPSGLVLALTLVQNGAKVRIVEKDQHVHIGQRGSGIQPRTLEAYNLLGVLPDILANGIPLPPMRFYKLPGGKEPVKTAYIVAPEDPTPSTPYNNPWMVGQCIAEEILRKHLATYGCHVELGTELRTFEQYPDHVVAHLVKKDAGEEKLEVVTCHWLAGTDGAKGVVRKQLGLTFVGESLSERTVFGEIVVKGLDGDHWHVWGDYKTKVVTLRPTETEGVFTFAIAGAVDHARIYADHDALVQALKDGTERDDLVFGEVKWKTDYKPSVRMVDRFAEGRVFVAGDAAHVHSPSGAQGMNSSVQDAFSLGWKLALVEKGVATPALLATYTEERLPVIAHMLGLSTRLHRAVVADAPDRHDRAVAARRGREVKQLGVNYRWSSIVFDERTSGTDKHVQQPLDAYGTGGGDGLRAGDRAPDAPGLIPLNVDGKDSGSEPTSLFRIFGPSYHTVLVFSATAGELESVCGLLKKYPSGLLRSVVVYPKGTDAPAAFPGGDVVVRDGDGHAYAGYEVAGEFMRITVVRPDGVIGGVVFGVEGMEKYLQGIFSAVTV